MGARTVRSDRSTAPTSAPADDLLRCSDAQRAQAVEAAKRACVEGRITLDDFGQRIDAIWASATYGDLRSVLSDIPADIVPSSATSRRSPLIGRRPLGPWLGYLAVMAILMTVWLLSTPGGYFWPMWPALGWGVPLVLGHRHGRFAGGWCWPARSHWGSEL